MRDNINIILCERTDDTITNINNIFDTITTDKDGKVSFTTVVFINTIEEYYKKLGLYFYIEKVDAGKITYLGSLEYASQEGKQFSNGETEYGSRPHSNQSISTFDVVDFNMLGAGSYEMQVYKYTDEEVVNLADKELEECIEFATDDKLVATYAFFVEDYK